MPSNGGGGVNKLLILVLFSIILVGCGQCDYSCQIEMERKSEEEFKHHCKKSCTSGWDGVTNYDCIRKCLELGNSYSNVTKY